MAGELVPAGGEVQTVEIVDRRGTVAYLNSLTASLDATVTGQAEVLAAGWSNAGFADPAVIEPVQAGMELLAAAAEQFRSAIDVLEGDHAALSEMADNLGEEALAKASSFYTSS